MSSTEESQSREVNLEHVIKKSDTGLVFYRKCTVDGTTYNLNNSVLIRDEGRYKLGYLLKIYCRTKGNERALVRWFFADADFGHHATEQLYQHEIFATSYTGKVAVSSLRKLIHVIWVANKDEIPESVPSDVYYVYRYFDHDKQTLVPHRQQLLQIRYMPKPTPDSVGSSLSVKEKAEVNVATISFSLPYTQNGVTFYKVCSIGKDKYKIGDCVLLGDRDGSSIRRIISFSYNHEKRPIAMGQFIYYQNEVTLMPEERMAMHFQEVLVSNWKRELLISNIKRKLIVIHQNIFQPVPENALKAVYFLKRYYDPFKKKMYPLAEPLTRSDFSIVPAPMEECPHTPVFSQPLHGTPTFKKCTLGPDSFCAGDYITLQSGSVCVRILRMYYSEKNAPVMDVNKLFTIRNVPSADRTLLSTSLIFSGEVYNTVPCTLFFERLCVVFNVADIANNSTYVAGDFFDAETKELFKLRKPAKLLEVDEVPRAGASLRLISNLDLSEDSSENNSSSCDSEGSEYRPGISEKEPAVKKKKLPSRTKKPRLSDDVAKVKEASSKSKDKEVVVEENVSKGKAQSHKKKNTEVKKAAKQITKEKKVVLGGLLKSTFAKRSEYSWLNCGKLTTSLGACVFVKLKEGMQLGRIVSIYRDDDEKESPVRLELFRIYLEEEMFVSKRESSTIHINEAFASNFVINALASQIDESADVVYLKKKEKIPPQNEIPKGRLFIRRYYHPRRHLLRSLVQPLDSEDLSIVPQPQPPINGLNEENKSLNRRPTISSDWNEVVTYSDKIESTDCGIQESSETEKINPVLEPKAVLSESLDELPFSGLTDFGENEPCQEKSIKEISSEQPSEAAKADVTANFKTISIVTEYDENPGAMTILPESMISFTVSGTGGEELQQDKPTITIVPNTSGADSNDASAGITAVEMSSASAAPEGIIQIIPSSSTDDKATELASEENTIHIVPDSGDIQLVPQSGEASLTSQIQIVTGAGDSSQVQVITDTSSIQIVPESGEGSATTATFLPTIISSEQDMAANMDVDITHAEDGCITIASITTKRNNTAKFEDSYTKDGRVYFRKCHFKDETIIQGDSVYVRCNDQNLNNEEESWKLGRVMEFYHSDYPVVRLLWFYVVEEMVTSKNERAGIHSQEVFASQCDDEIEISSIESKAHVIYLQKGETIPKSPDPSHLFCRRFYDPYKHSIKALKNRLSADDISILPEPVVSGKRNRSSKVDTPQSQDIKTPDVKRKRMSPSKVDTPSRSLTTGKNRSTPKMVVSSLKADDSEPKLYFASKEEVFGTSQSESIKHEKTQSEDAKQDSDAETIQVATDDKISASKNADCATSLMQPDSSENTTSAGKPADSQILVDVNCTLVSSSNHQETNQVTTDTDVQAIQLESESVPSSNTQLESETASVSCTAPICIESLPTAESIPPHSSCDLTTATETTSDVVTTIAQIKPEASPRDTASDSQMESENLTDLQKGQPVIKPSMNISSDSQMETPMIPDTADSDVQIKTVTEVFPTKDSADTKLETEETDMVEESKEDTMECDSIISATVDADVDAERGNQINVPL